MLVRRKKLGTYYSFRKVRLWMGKVSSMHRGRCRACIVEGLIRDIKGFAGKRITVVCGYENCLSMPVGNYGWTSVRY